MVLPEDMLVVMIFQIGDTQIDIIPANLRAKRAAVLEAIDDVIEDLPVRVVNLRDLILLKMWAIPDRPEMGKRMQDETDVVGLLEINHERLSTEDIAYVCRSLQAATLPKTQPSIANKSSGSTMCWRIWV